MRMHSFRFASLFLSVVLAATVEAQQIVPYRVEIEIDRQQKNVRGVERIRVLPASADLFTIPLEDQTIDLVSLEGSPVTLRADSLSDGHGERLILVSRFSAGEISHRLWRRVRISSIRRRFTPKSDRPSREAERKWIAFVASS